MPNSHLIVSCIVTFLFSAMSQISGYKRTLSHANSIVVESNVPKFGVTSEHEEELAEVGIEIIKSLCGGYRNY